MARPEGVVYCFVVRGLMAERLDFIRIVGKGSRAQEDDFIFFDDSLNFKL